MRRIQPDANSFPPLTLTTVLSGTRSSVTLAGVLQYPDGPRMSRCLRCLDEPCLRFTPAETGALRQATQVCPTDAIKHPRSLHGPVITAECVGCGVCAMRCPVGAIAVSDMARAGATVHTAETGDLAYRVASDALEFFRARGDLAKRLVWSERSASPLADLLWSRSLPLRQSSFYPLVAALFTVAGFPVWRPAQGDTNNRVDVILVDDEDSLPVEVKSASEVSVINVKSVQQALENKIVLDERAYLPSRPSSSTLVVGYEYPPARSDVTELVEDIYSAYKISVGLVSMRRLYELALERTITGVGVSRGAFSSLRGPL